ncbi:heavy-metal-associated domain-containing protein [Pedobacter sp.]|jgi:copper chaperone|uniref:heavy-metal-associated domain-containing protein n=1 Tax=Pedobacter sp. TaxID=1411316 RepID=UPI002B7CA3D2|nr:cation transporter [Pedobacter sp.]HWW39715.1 cation transporter [Pedobacter sp.]
METLKFKTNIKCGGCIATVTPFLNDLETVQSWKVDVDNADKVLTVEGSASAPEVIDVLNKAGYKAEKI